MGLHSEINLIAKESFQGRVIRAKLNTKYLLKTQENILIEYLFCNITTTVFNVIVLL